MKQALGLEVAPKGSRDLGAKPRHVRANLVGVVRAGTDRRHQRVCQGELQGDGTDRYAMCVADIVDAEGGEIGRAQVVQAMAAGVPPHTEMNLILLKREADFRSQVIVAGKVWGRIGLMCPN